MIAVNRRPIRILLCLLAIAFSLPFPPVRSQTATTPNSVLPGPKPPDASLAWKQLVGIYDFGSPDSAKQTVILLENDQRLFIQPQGAAEKRKEIQAKSGTVLMNQPGGRTSIYDERIAPDGTVAGFSYLTEHFVRIDAGSDPTHFFHITPAKPIEQVRAAALAAKPPDEPGPFRKPDLVELVALDSAIRLDIRYAQSNNFLGTPVYTQARAFMQRPAAEALVRALHKLQPLGYGLLIHDGYRPWYVTKIFWDVTPPKDHIFVADPEKGSRHNRGCAVDLTLYDLATGKLVEMPGLYDEMSPRSYPDFPGGTSLQRWNRELLRRAMESEGFTVNEDEWWHFDYKDWKHYPILNVPFEKLNVPAAKS
ncbi:MAG: M15 family metallopeptidase [Candidatus Acidiferrum sp.]